MPFEVSFDYASRLIVQWIRRWVNTMWWINTIGRIELYRKLIFEFKIIDIFNVTIIKRKIQKCFKIYKRYVKTCVGFNYSSRHVERKFINFVEITVSCFGFDDDHHFTVTNVVTKGKTLEKIYHFRGNWNNHTARSLITRTPINLN